MTPPPTPEAPTGPFSLALGRTLTALAVVIVLGLGVVLAAVHPRFLFGTLVGDDAGYYLAVARNVCLGHGFSFDRLDPTNGFNPLMPALLIPLDRLCASGLDLVACFRIGVLVTWAALAWSLLSARRLAADVFAAQEFPPAARPLALGALLWFLAAFVAPKGYYGMDAFLTLALGLAYAASVARHGVLARGSASALRDASLLAATVLSRVDALPLAAAAFGVMMARVRRAPERAFGLVARAAWFAAFVVPYLLWNRREFGDWLPISARLKSSFPAWDPAASLRTVLGSSLNPADEAALFLSLIAALVWLAASMRRPRLPQHDPGSDGPRAAMTILALGLGGRIAWLLLFSRLDVQGSYFILAHPFLALCVLLAGARVAGQRGAVVASIALAVLGSGLLGLKARASIPSVAAIARSQGDEWALARRIHDRVAPGEVVFGGAFGLIGFVADRPWINGDGVANTRAYQDAIGAGRLADHLARHSVDYVVVTASPPRELPGQPFGLTVESPIHGARDSIVVDPARVVLHESMRRNGGTSLWLVRWGSAPD